MPRLMVLVSMDRSKNRAAILNAEIRSPAAHAARMRSFFENMAPLPACSGTYSENDRLFEFIWIHHGTCARFQFYCARCGRSNVECGAAVPLKEPGVARSRGSPIRAPLVSRFSWAVGSVRVAPESHHDSRTGRHGPERPWVARGEPPTTNCSIAPHEQRRRKAPSASRARSFADLCRIVDRDA